MSQNEEVRESCMHSSSDEEGSSSSSEQISESDEDTSYHPFVRKVSDDPVVVRISNASEFYAMKPKQQRFKLRLSLKRKQQFNDETGTMKRSSGRSTTKKKYSDLDNDYDLLEESELKESISIVPTNGMGDQKNFEQTVPGLLNVEAPPPGILSSLWYSNESALHVFVVEKILGWKRRCTNSCRAGMDISQLIKTRPLVLPNEFQSDASSQTSQEDLQELEEEVILIKWRGRSYLHCSWERIKDVIELDPTNSAKGKIKRYFQSQEQIIGPHWKQVLSDSQAGADEDYFPPTYIEVERVLASDETEMDLSIFAKQRGLNLVSQNKSPDENDDEIDNGGVLRSSLTGCVTNSVGRNECEISKDWDPEDYVRYVIKWKGLPAAEMTWEYWKDLKMDFVDVVEDYWLRQKRPSSGELRSKSHPNVRDFKKLKESPIFGISKVERPIVGFQCSSEIESESDENEVILRLREYQLEGVNWLLWNWWNHRSCILADEMGLGKTIQTMTFLEQLHRLNSTKVRGPFMIVAPLTLVAQWQSEATAWAPDFNTIVYHGSADARSFIVDHEFYYTEPFVTKAEAQRFQRNNITKFDLLITTYEVIMKDISILSKIRWKALVVDEAHRLKNKKSRLFADLSNVPREFCLLLTGTPLQNSTEELWALLNFAEPQTFASGEAFTQQFGQLTDAKQVRDLHAILKPYLLRRVKEDVEKSLPPKEETILEVTLTPIQKAYYKAIYEKNTQYLFRGAKPSNSPSLMNVMMELRKCCNHPFLIRGAEQRILEDAAGKAISLHEVLDMKHRLSVEALNKFPEQLVKSSGKMVLIDKLLPKLKDGGHKVLIFSQMVKTLDLLEELLRIKRYRYERLDGSVHASSRQAAVHRFHSKTYDRFVMLLSTRAGGLGLNLTAADTVIIFDSDWNPQNDLQAMARAHRIGQTKAVRVYRLLTAKTYEMHMFHSASMKLGLDRAVLAHQRQNETENENSRSSKSERENQAKEIDELLKKGAYDVFRDDNDEEATKFMDTDIDDLLKTSSRTVTYGNNNNNMSSGLGSFSKASFVASGDDAAEVDLDDPNFWEKAIGLEAPTELSLDSDMSFLAGLENKRSRKQVQVYDPYAAFADRERKKLEKLAAKVRAEKEEKEKKRTADKMKKLEEKERKVKEKELAKLVKESNVIISSPKPIQTPPIRFKTKVVEYDSPKKDSKLCRQRMLRTAEETLYGLTKQVWKKVDRDSVLAQLLKFGFGRFTKIRHESNLLHLPIQDIEVFLRSCIYQCGVQAGVTVMTYLIRTKSCNMGDSSKLDFIRDIVGCIEEIKHQNDGGWLCTSILEALKMREKIEKGESVLRLPAVIVESEFLCALRSGASIRILQRLSFLQQFNRVMTRIIDDIFNDLGHEELGKRGCPDDLSLLDMDSKINFITTDELLSWLDSVLRYEGPMNDWVRRCSWWNRSCDLALIAGSLLHGLGSYRRMQEDPNLPFSKYLSKGKDMNSQSDVNMYELVINASKNLFERAMNKAKLQSNEKAAAIISEEVLAAIHADRTPIDTTEPPNSDVEIVSNGVFEEPNSNKSDDAASPDGITLSSVVKSARLAFGCSYHEDKQCRQMPDGKLLDTLLCCFVNSLDMNYAPTNNDSDSCSVNGHIVVSKNDDIELMKKMENDISKSSLIYGNALRVPCERGKMAAANISNCVQALRGTSIVKYLDDGSSIATGVAHPSLFLHKVDKNEFLKVSDIFPIALSRPGLLALLNTDLDHLSEIEKTQQNSLALLGDNTGMEVSDRIQICLTCLTHGISENTKGRISDILYQPLLEYLGVILPDMSIDSFQEKCTLCVDEVNISEQITPSQWEKYVRDELIPHCLRLCLYEKKDCVWDRSQMLAPLPDPYLSLELHGDEAVMRSMVLLRRICIMKCVRCLVFNDHLKVHQLIEFLQTSCDDETTDLPIWWNPSIHDLALLLSAALHGIFAVLKLRNSGQDDSIPSLIFSNTAITRHIKITFLEKLTESGDSIISSKMQIEQPSIVSDWVEAQAQVFPSAQAIERRIARICGVFSHPSKVGNEIAPYLNLPMFDHAM